MRMALKYPANKFPRLRISPPSWSSSAMPTARSAPPERGPSRSVTVASTSQREHCFGGSVLKGDDVVCVRQ